MVSFENELKYSNEITTLSKDKNKMIDTYSKVMLTVIAITLSAFAFKDMLVSPANAERDALDLKLTESYLYKIQKNTARS